MCFGASVLLRKASALKRIDVRYGSQNALFSKMLFLEALILKILVVVGEEVNFLPPIRNMPASL